MKTKITLSILFSALFFLGCQKNNSQPNNGNPVITTGTLYFHNTEANSYNIYLDGNYIGEIVSGKTSTNGYTITAGVSHDLKAVQYNGYVFTPTTYTGTAIVNSGQTTIWNF